MRDKYIIQYVDEISTAIQEIKETTNELKVCLLAIIDKIEKNKEKENADDKQDTKKRGRKKKQPDENDGGSGAEDEPVQHNEVEEDKGGTH